MLDGKPALFEDYLLNYLSGLIFPTLFKSIVQ